MVVDLVWGRGDLGTFHYGIRDVWATRDEGINELTNAIPIFQAHIGAQTFLDGWVQIANSREEGLDEGVVLW